MSKYELVQVSLKDYGFSFQVVRFPKESLSDKLVMASSETGLISRMEYQDFLFSECVVNLDRLHKFIAETSEGEQDNSFVLRNKIESEICRVNQELTPSNLVINENGVIKMKDASEGIPLSENPEWNRVVEESNPYLRRAEDDGATILDGTPILPPMDFLAGPDLFSPQNNNVVEKHWDKLGIVLRVKQFNEEDLPDIFMDIDPAGFEQDLHYKIFIIQQVLETPSAVLGLTDLTNTGAKYGLKTVVDDLFGFCIDVNPFLDIGEVDLRRIRKQARQKKKSKVAGGSQENGQDSKTKNSFEEVSKEEVISLPDRMKKRVIGQDEAIDKIVDTIQIASCGLRGEEKPIAAYMLCGITGVGKTHTSKALAEELCGSRDSLIRVDCSEYTQHHDIQKLIGAPPGYMGYEDAGYLTNAVQDNPFSVVLFDEIEKASSRLFDLLLQILDDARLTDNKGVVTDFSNCVILLTSNVGVSQMEKVKGTMGFGDVSLLTEERKEKAVKEALKSRFRPEFINRLDDIVTFNSLTKEDALQVVDLMLGEVSEKLNKKEIVVEFDDSVREMIFEKGFSKKYGARPLQRKIDAEVVKPLAKKILHDEIKSGSTVNVGFDGEKVYLKGPKKKTSKRKTKTTNASN